MRLLIRDHETLASEAATWYGKRFSFDTETSGLRHRTDRLVGVALHFEDNRSYYITIEHTMPLWNGETYSERFVDPDVLVRTLSPLFAQDVLMVAHNAKFDMHFLHKTGCYIEGRLFDTLLAAQLLDENRSNGLKDLAPLVDMAYEKYQTMNTYRGFARDEILGAPLDDVAQYAMNDVEATWRLHTRFKTELAEARWRDATLLDVFNNTWMPLLGVLQQMEARGIALDLNKVRALREDFVERRDRHEANVRKAGLDMVLNRWEPKDVPAIYMEMATEDDLENAYENLDGQLVIDKDGVQLPIITHDMLGRNRTFRPRIVKFDVGSRTQLGDLIYNYSGIQIPTALRLKTNKDGSYKVDKDNLRTLLFYAGSDAPSFIREALEWRKADKFIGTYLDRFLADADPNDHDSISTVFSMAVSERAEKGGTKTGRLASSSPNLQNIPSRFEIGKLARGLFVARPNNLLAVGDLGQAELRMLAHYSKDPELLTAFEEGRDLHVLTGAGMARKTYEEVLEAYQNDEQWAKDVRMLGKTANFALNYGMGPLKFQRYLLVENNYEVTREQAKDWIDGYNATYQVMTNWKQSVMSYVSRTGYVVTLGGRFRRLPNAFSTDDYLRSEAQRQAVNAIIQGSVGDVICASMIPIQKALRGLGGSLLLQVHDELVAEVPEENAHLAKVIMEDLMIREVNKVVICPQVSDVHLGLSWGAAKG
jgi:DNA polymerase I-like protein with 3'-5' exonuclease and polymerase domains